MPDRSKKRKRNRNKCKNNTKGPQNTKVADVGSEATTGDEETIENVRERIDTRGESGEATSVQQSEQFYKNANESNQGDVKFHVEPDCETSEHKFDYVVEIPEQVKNCGKPKIGDVFKSKSLDDIDTLKISDVTGDGEIMIENVSESPVIDNVLVFEDESDVEWETTDLLCGEFTVSEMARAVNTLNVNTSLMHVADCEQTQALSPEEELSLRQYLQTLDLATCPQKVEEIKVENTDFKINNKDNSKLRKNVTNEETPRPAQRFLEVIDEEVSNESSSQRASFLKDDYSDLEDDVFQDKTMATKTTEKFPLPLPRSARPKKAKLIPQDCLLVDARIVQPKIDEACGDWIVENMAKINGAEVVYLTSSSSSASDIHDVVEEPKNTKEINYSFVCPQTPIIEHTEPSDIKLEKNECISKTPTSSPQLIVSNAPSTKKSEQTSFTVDIKEVIVLTKDSTNPSPNVLRIDESDENEDEVTKNKCDFPSDVLIDSDSSLEINKKTENPVFKLKEPTSKIDSEINDLKLELNHAISNLMKEVEAEKENEANNSTTGINLTRQDSSSSVGSQCTVKYISTTSSLTDIANLVHEYPSKPDTSNKNNNTQNVTDIKIPVESHVKNVFERVTGSVGEEGTVLRQPNLLKELCVSRIASLPYGDNILEELASVSEKLQNISLCTKDQNLIKMQFYPLPDVSSTKNVSLILKKHDTTLTKPIPPLVTPRNSSLKKQRNECSRSGIQIKRDPCQYVCLSPSQKMLMEKTNTIIEKDNESELMNINYLDRHENNKYYSVRKSTNYDVKSDAIPFKSQTGNRLLAIIRDPAVKINRWGNYTSEDLHNSSSYTNISNKYEPIQFRSSKSARDVRAEMTFCPIPPPRPRKYSSVVYESDESSDFTDHSFQSISEQKYFNFSTGHLNKEIEEDVSNIQDLHRKYYFTRDTHKSTYLHAPKPQRRPSLPNVICEQQMEYVRRKENKVEAEIQKVENQRMQALQRERQGPRAPLYTESDVTQDHRLDGNNYHISRKRDVALHSNTKSKDATTQLSSSFKSSQEEIMRKNMYYEYMCQMAEREERKQHKVIKITTKPISKESKATSISMPMLHSNEVRVGNNRIEEEFISKAKERWDKLGIKDPETDVEDNKDVYREPKVVETKIKVIEAGEEKDVQNLPSHLREFVQFAAKGESSGDGAVWTPGSAPSPGAAPPQSTQAPPAPPPPPVWRPASAGPSPQPQRKSFQPVDDTKAIHHSQQSIQNGSARGPATWDSAPQLSANSSPRLPTSHSAPPAGFGALGGRAPAQHPAVNHLQSEDECKRINHRQDQRRETPRDRPAPPSNDPVHALRRGYVSDSDGRREGRGMGDGEQKLDGIGPTTKEGMPVALRSEVKDQHSWYKKMYDTIHKSKCDDDNVTIRYKIRRGDPSIHRSGNRSQYAYFDPRSGYLSEPEGGAGRGSTWSDYDSEAGGRRRTASAQGDREEETSYMPSNKYSTLASARASQEVYKNQPGRIENYVPGRSSVVDKEAKQWWDEVMDIFDGQLSSASTNSLQQPSPKDKKDVTSAILSKSNMARALKESGYESDSTLVFRRRGEETEAPPLSPAERRAAYRDLQAGGEPPLRGFRSPAPPRHQESPRRYVESDVNIHYRCPVRTQPLPHVPERELARRQAEHMRRLHQEERRRKYLQELQDMQSRRHTDNFTPSQKTILPLNRYDEPDSLKNEHSRGKRTFARALYAFVGQNSRELNFRKGDVIGVRRQIDANWYEGELNGKIGLFPYNYVEIVRGDASEKKPSPATEGKARARFDFTAQTNLELPLKKGEVVILTRRVDHNWWEGRNNGGKTGIFPDSYVHVLQEPSLNKPELPPPQNHKPLASPASHGLLVSSAKQSMGAHSYQPQLNSVSLSNGPQPTQPLTGTHSANFHATPVQTTLTPSERGYGPPSTLGVDLNNREPLYIDTNAEAVPYRAMYKYRPQNPDELELCEGDTVYVLEKCDDGWYVGSSQRTGTFGTFPGNYVERI